MKAALSAARHGSEVQRISPKKDVHLKFSARSHTSEALNQQRQRQLCPRTKWDSAGTGNRITIRMLKKIMIGKHDISFSLSSQRLYGVSQLSHYKRLAILTIKEQCNSITPWFSKVLITIIWQLSSRIICMFANVAEFQNRLETRDFRLL